MNLGRRHFLKLTATAGGGLALGFSLSGCSNQKRDFPNQHLDAIQPNAFLQLSSEGAFILQLHRAEMGQGVYTGMATLVAEELGINPRLLVIEHAQFHPDFLDPEMKIMLTGGSASIRNNHRIVREAAASFAAILRQAATALQVPTAQQANLSTLIQELKAGGQWQEFLKLAESLPAPETIELKPAEQFQFIGKHNDRLDAYQKITGRATYTLDNVDLEAYDAVLIRCPHIGGKVISFNAERALTSPKVIKIIEVDGAIAVIAKGYWYARQAAAQIDIEWDKGPRAGFSSELLSLQQQALLNEKGHNAEELGDSKLATGEYFEANYEVPYLAHACMEPPCAIAKVSEKTAEIWAGNQAPDVVIGAVAHVTGLKKTTFGFTIKCWAVALVVKFFLTISLRLREFPSFPG